MKTGTLREMVIFWSLFIGFLFAALFSGILPGEDEEGDQG